MSFDFMSSLTVVVQGSESFIGQYLKLITHCLVNKSRPVNKSQR